MEGLIQSQNDFTQSFDMLETKINQFVNTYKNEKNLSYQYLTNFDISNLTDETQESWYLENSNQDSIHCNILNLSNPNSLTN